MEKPLWYVRVNGETYEGDLDALKLLVSKGYVTRADSVRREDAEWTHAGGIPDLEPLFVDVTGGPASNAAPPPDLSAEIPVCGIHPDLASEFICLTCGRVACRSCVKLVGIPAVAVCGGCGELARPIAEVRRRVRTQALRSEPFGLDDFRRALAFPFEEWVTSLGIAAVVGILVPTSLATVTMFSWAIPVGILVVMSFLVGFVSTLLRSIADGDADTRPQLNTSMSIAEPVATLRLGGSVFLVSAGPVFFLAARWLLAAMARAVNPEAAAIQTPSMVGVTVAAVWAAAFYPVALLVGGYSREWSAVFNPLIVIDTVTRLGTVFWRFFALYLVVAAGCLVLAGIGVALSVTLPLAGKLAGSLVLGAAIAYVNIVTAYLLGRLIFKQSEMLGLMAE